MHILSQRIAKRTSQLVCNNEISDPVRCSRHFTCHAYIKSCKRSLQGNETRKLNSPNAGAFVIFPTNVSKMCFSSPALLVVSPAVGKSSPQTWNSNDACVLSTHLDKPQRHREPRAGMWGWLRWKASSALLRWPSCREVAFSYWYKMVIAFCWISRNESSTDNNELSIVLLRCRCNKHQTPCELPNNSVSLTCNNRSTVLNQGCSHLPGLRKKATKMGAKRSDNNN